MSALIPFGFTLSPDRRFYCRFTNNWLCWFFLVKHRITFLDTYILFAFFALQGLLPNLMSLFTCIPAGSQKSLKKW